MDSILLECPDQWMAYVALAHADTPDPARAALFSAAECGGLNSPVGAWSQSSHTSFRCASRC